MENNNVNTGNNQEPQQAGQEGEKTFTQAEVNRIVQERLARVKTPDEPNQRELDLQARETALYAREAVETAGLDKSLAEEFQGMDKAAIDKCLKIIAPYAKKASEPFLNPVGLTGGDGSGSDATIRAAMGLKKR